MLDRILNSFKSLSTSKFDWMELETLSGEIAHAQRRLEAARASADHGLARIIQHEITEIEARRARVLADLTKGIAAHPIDEKHPIEIPVGQPQAERSAEEKPQERAAVEAMTPNDRPAPEPPPASDTPAGDASMWDKVSAADVERLKRGLATRRSEMLARHAEELKALEAEQAEIEVIERAIAAFIQKFRLTTAAEVVPFDAERVPVQAG